MFSLYLVKKGSKWNDFWKMIQCREDNNQYLNTICTEIEDHAQKMNIRDPFMISSVKDANGILLTETDRVAERWRPIRAYTQIVS